MNYYDDACMIIFLNQAFTLDIITIAQRYAVREIKNIKVDDLPGRAHYNKAGSWYPILPNGEIELMSGGTAELPQEHTPTSGITRHNSSI